MPRGKPRWHSTAGWRREKGVCRGALEPAGERMGWGTLNGDTGGELRGDGIANTEATDLQLTRHLLAHLWKQRGDWRV